MTNMKKFIGIIIAVAVAAGMAALLAGNKKKIQEQSQAVANAGTSETVSTCLVEEGLCDRSFTSNGVAQAEKELNFVSDVTGRVVEICVSKGDRVRKGDALLKIDSELIEADYKAAKAAYEALSKDEKRFARSCEAGGVSSQQLDNIRTQLVAAESRLAVSKWKLDNATVKAPISGTVNNRFVEVGALIAPNAPLFEIVDNSRIKVICNVSEDKVSRVSAGQKVVAESGGKSFSGVIKSVGVKTDRGLNYPVEVLLDSNPELRTGSYMKVRFGGSDADKAILIPRKAVVGSVLAANVYVVEDGKALKREVKLGEMYGDRIEITEGLEKGEEIVVAGIMNISDGTAVTVSNR